MVNRGAGGRKGVTLNQQQKDARLAVKTARTKKNKARRAESIKNGFNKNSTRAERRAHLQGAK